MGERYIDYHRSIFQQDTELTLSDNSFPPFIRVCPIIKWSYQDIWNFLRFNNFKYPELYNIGYTSIGSIQNTKPNPKLALSEGKYLPAYLLEKEEDERCGRIKIKK